MELYTNIPHVDKPVSRILYGTASTPFLMGRDNTEVLDAVLATGVQTIDTARNYTASEKSIGDWMAKRKNRNQLVILSKGGHPSVFGRKRITEKDIRKDLERSLKYLQTDYIDIYLLHRDDPSQPVDEAVEVLNALHKEGKIGAFGGSNWTHDRILQANAYANEHGLQPFEVSSPNFGLAEQVNDPWDGTCVTISGREGAPAREWYRQTQMPVMAYSSLGRGLFSGKLSSDDLSNVGKVMDEAAQKGYGYEENFERLRRCEKLAAEKGVSVPQIALSWLFYQGMNMFAVVSTSSGERMKSNLAALELELTEKECNYLNLEADL